MFISEFFYKQDNLQLNKSVEDSGMKSVIQNEEIYMDNYNKFSKNYELNSMNKSGNNTMVNHGLEFMNLKKKRNSVQSKVYLQS